MSSEKVKKVSKLTAIILSIVASLIFSAIATIIAGLNFKHENAVMVVLSTVFTGVATAGLVMAIGCFITGGLFDSKFERAAAALLLFFAFVLVAIIAIINGAKWWIALVLILCAIPMPLLSAMFIYRKNLVLVMDNEKPDYKDFKTREAERAENSDSEKVEELPEIKSFK